MSFLDRHTAMIIGGPATTTDFLGGFPTLISEDPTITNNGWDTLIRTFALRRPTLTPEDLAALYPIGNQIGTRTWWITGSKPQQFAPGVWLAIVDCKGWASAKPLLVKVGAVADSQSADSVTIAGATYAKVEVHENAPTVTVSYLVANIDADGVDKTALVGTAQSPPVTIAVAATGWSGLTKYTYHYPNGWVLMGSDHDRLPGCNATLVTDSYKYIRSKTPG